MNERDLGSALEWLEWALDILESKGGNTVKDLGLRSELLRSTSRILNELEWQRAQEMMKREKRAKLAGQWRTAADWAAVIRNREVRRLPRGLEGACEENSGGLLHW